MKKKKFKKFIISKPCNVEDTYKLFKFSKKRIAYIEKIVDEILGKENGS